MNGREAYSEELLSAYLDGELTPEERQHVEQRLESSPTEQRKLRALRALSDQLKGLGRYQLGGQASARILAAIGRSQPEGPTATSSFHELLSAYVDGELTAGEQELVEQQLDQNRSGQRLLDEFRGLQGKLGRLAHYRLDQGFADRVMQQIAAGAGGLSPAGTRRQPARRAAHPRRHRAAWAAVAIAAALVLMFVLIPRGQREEIRVAQPDAVSPPPILPAAPTADLATDVPPSTLPAPAIDPQWTLVSSIGRNAKQKLVLVYEVTVTEEGVEQAAFSDLLRRHRIGFNQTMPVGPEEQEDLLKHRFLDDVQMVDPGEDADRVHLYLVTTMGSTADAIYMDLMGRPRGFASFFLNLTTREAHDRVLNRLCEASGVDDRMGQAVQLLANLGMFSRTARSVGAFGAIRWVEPALLEPPIRAEDQPAGSNGQEGGAGVVDDRRGDAVPADFTCELLFVVRELRSRE